MKNQSINLGYNAQAQKFYIVINGIAGDDPIKDAVLALVKGISGNTEIAPIEGLELESVPVMDDDMTVPATAEAVETIPANTDIPATAESLVPTSDEVPAPNAVSTPDISVETPAPDAAADAPVADEPSEPSVEPAAETPAGAIFKMRAGVPLIGILVKAGKAVLNRADGTVTVSDNKAIEDLAHAGLERIG